MTRRAAIVCVLISACSGEDGGRVRFAPLDSDGTHLRDELGRIALLRGINARVEGVFDVTFDDGREPLEEIPPLERADCERMRALGFNLLRLPINWSGVEPVEGTYDDGYLARVRDAVDCAADAGLLVLIDLHQDAYSKEIGEDGAPLWAIEPGPEMLLEGPLDDLDARRQSRQVLAAFESFFAEGDPHQLQAAFIAMLEVVAAGFADHPAVVGFEIFNEPVASPAGLDPFHEAAAAALRAAAPTKLVFFEPPAVRNFLDSQPRASAPFPTGGAVYSPHAYTGVFLDTDLTTLTKDDLRFGIDNARAEAAAWGTPLFIGEFGVGPDRPGATTWMAWQSELHDEVLASSAFWLWKEVSQGGWGLHDLDGATWVERPAVVAWVSRLHAQRIAARSALLDTTDGQLTLTPIDPLPAPHVLYVPESIEDVTVTCDGTRVAAQRDPATGLIEVACTSTLVITP